MIRGVVALGFVGACAGDASLALVLDLPSDPRLRPADISTVTVRVDPPATRPDLEPVVRTVPLRGDAAGPASFDAGDLDPVADASISVTLRTAAGRLAGYGAAATPVDVGDGATEVVVPVRRPIVYAADAARVGTYDPTVDATDTAYQGSLVGAGAEVVVALDAATMVLVGGGQVRRVDTATDAVIGAPIALPATAVDAAAGPGALVVVATGDGAVLVDLDSGQVTDLAAGAVDRVSVGLRDGQAVAYLLRDRVVPPVPASGACSGASTVEVVPLAGGAAEVLLQGRPLSDVAAGPRLDGAFVADPCAGRVLAVDGVRELAEVSRPSLLVASGTTLWAAGDVGPTVLEANGPGPDDDVLLGANLTLVAVGADGSGRREVALASQSQTLVSQDDPANEISNILQADAMVPIDLAVLPGDEQIALIGDLSASGSAIGLDLFTDLAPAMTVRVVDVQLIDVASGAPAQRTRTLCDLDVNLNPGVETLLATWTCVPPATGEAPEGPEFAPRALAVVGGAR